MEDVHYNCFDFVSNSKLKNKNVDWSANNLKKT